MGINKKECALVVDDSETNRQILRLLLENISYEVIEATNGLEAIICFLEKSPDIIFMDIMMPKMDGYDASERIKQLSGDHFVPIIALTAISDKEGLAKCIDKGADDVLTKPYDPVTLYSKINAMVRICNLHRKSQALTARMQHDEEIAEEVYKSVVTAHNIAMDKIGHWQRPTTTFSGDMLLTAYGPGGDLHVLLGDFTGHGLAAAIGALPASETFHGMINKGFSSWEILEQINRKLCQLLPCDMFMAACYVNISSDFETVTIFNSSMPTIFVIDGESGKIKNCIESHHFPLGIDEEFPKARDLFEKFPLTLNDRIICYSDGVTESQNIDGEEFGEMQLEWAVQRGDANSALENIQTAVDKFCGEAPQHDDISLVVIPCVPDILPNHAELFSDGREFEVSSSEGLAENEFEFAITLKGESLKKIDPIPLLMHQIQEVRGLNLDSRILFTLLTELYLNALDHGVLSLDSELKANEEGFLRYFELREQRLNHLNQGFVSIVIRVQQYGNGGYINIVVLDSGNGFDFGAYKEVESEGVVHHGRGIGLVRSLCDDLKYSAPGNKVMAEYRWGIGQTVTCDLKK